MTQEEILRGLKENYSLHDTLLRKNYDVPEDLMKDIKAMEKQYAEEVVLPQLEQHSTCFIPINIKANDYYMYI